MLVRAEFTQKTRRIWNMEYFISGQMALLLQLVNSYVNTVIGICLILTRVGLPWLLEAWRLDEIQSLEATL